MKVEIRTSTITKLVNAAIKSLAPELEDSTAALYGLSRRREAKELRDALRYQFKSILVVPRKLHGTKDFEQSTD